MQCSSGAQFVAIVSPKMALSHLAGYSTTVSGVKAADVAAHVHEHANLHFAAFPSPQPSSQQRSAVIVVRFSALRTSVPAAWC